jgi:peptidoglycan LD-endopeptidase CwlK
MFKFSTASKQRISQVHELLQILAYETIKVSPYDFGIISNGGLRTAEEQKELFDKGYSKCDGYNKKSYHQSGLALDFVPYIDGSFTWKNEKAFLSIANKAFHVWSAIKDTKGYFLHWGGYWSAKDLNSNGLLDINDKLGWDLPHFELRKYPQEKGVYPVEWDPV